MLSGQDSVPSQDHGVEVMLGIGSRIGGPRVTNYQSINNVLESTNLGRATPQFLTGLGFPMCSPAGSAKTSPEPGNDPKICGNAFYNRLSGFVSVQFSTGGSSSISGYTVGLAVHLSKYLHALAGFSLSPIAEPSPGFTIAASQYVSSHRNQYPGIDPSKLLENAPNAFDGFQDVIPPPVDRLPPQYRFIRAMSSRLTIAEVFLSVWPSRLA